MGENYLNFMNTIKAIGFDWGGVIHQTPGPSFNDAAAQILGVDNEDFRRAYFLHNHLVNKGTKTTDYCDATEMWTNILNEIGKMDKFDAFIDFLRSRPQGKIDQRMLNLLEVLRKDGWKLGLLSNNSVEGGNKMKDLGIDKYFDSFLISAEIDAMKPEPEAFHKLANSLNVNISELAFIDDSKRSLENAEEIGYVPIFFTSTDKLVSDLKKLDIIDVKAEVELE